MTTNVPLTEKEAKAAVADLMEGMKDFPNYIKYKVQSFGAVQRGNKSQSLEARMERGLRAAKLCIDDTLQEVIEKGN